MLLLNLGNKPHICIAFLVIQCKMSCKVFRFCGHFSCCRTIVAHELEDNLQLVGIHYSSYLQADVKWELNDTDELRTNSSSSNIGPLS